MARVVRHALHHVGILAAGLHEVHLVARVAQVELVALEALEARAALLGALPSGNAAARHVVLVLLLQDKYTYCRSGIGRLLRKECANVVI